MIQLVFDLIILLLVIGMTAEMLVMNRVLKALSQRRKELWTSDEQEITRLKEIAAGLREPEPEKPHTPPKKITCPCGHLLNSHMPTRGGRCTVIGSSPNRACACEWGQPDIMDWMRGTGQWAR